MILTFSFEKRCHLYQQSKKYLDDKIEFELKSIQWLIAANFSVSASSNLSNLKFSMQTPLLSANHLSQLSSHAINSPKN